MYFQNFPKIILDSATGPTSGVVLATDILRRVGFSGQGITGSSFFVKYNINDTDSPESISDYLYGSSEYHWIVMMFNDKFDGFFEWPLSSRKFEKYMTKKYDGVTLFLDDVGFSGGFLGNDTVTMHSGTGVTGWTCLVKDYDPTLHKLTITGISSGNAFTVNDNIRAYNATGGITIDTAYVGGATVARIVTDSAQSLHHFETSGSTFDGYNGPDSLGDVDVGGGYQTATSWLDPLSKYDGTTQVPLSDASVTFSDTLLYGYAVGGSNNYVKTNYEYEQDKNEGKREISLLKPEFLSKVVKEYKLLLKR